jgi:hypothetical protein
MEWWYGEWQRRLADFDQPYGIPGGAWRLGDRRPSYLGTRPRKQVNEETKPQILRLLGEVGSGLSLEGAFVADLV